MRDLRKRIGRTTHARSVVGSAAQMKWPGAVGAAPAVTGPLGGPMTSLYVRRVDAASQ